VVSPAGVPAPALVSIFVGGNPAGVAITPDGRHAYVASEISDVVSVIDAATATIGATITVGSGPVGVAITPDGSHAYVTNFDAGTVVVIPAVPTLTTISPTQGPTTGGTVVTITGTSLDGGPPEPAQIPRMQLQRRLVVLPFPERAHGLAQPADSRLAQNNRHSPVSHTTTPTVRIRFFRPTAPMRRVQ
jgi:YVTN family beta-propeller protein